MKILIIAEFDPAGVCLGHRDLLKAAGRDCRVALECAYTTRQLDADYCLASWCYKPPEKVYPPREEMMSFAEKADIIQFCPAIGQPWADRPIFGPDYSRDPPSSLFFSHEEWARIRMNTNAALVAFFHGSVAAWASRGRYRDHYYQRGYRLAASTLDYATEMEAAYLPPFADSPPGKVGFAKPRQDGETLRIIHTPTNPSICGTQDFINILTGMPKGSIQGTVARKRPHEAILALKQQAHAGFDHLRGSFSVNHLENCATGLAALCALKPEYAARMAYEGIGPMPSPYPIEDAQGLERAMGLLAMSPELTREFQQACRVWVSTYFNREAITKRLERFYMKIVGGCHE